MEAVVAGVRVRGVGVWGEGGRGGVCRCGGGGEDWVLRVVVRSRVFFFGRGGQGRLGVWHFKILVVFVFVFSL